jgi:hypothetical protein
MGLRKEKQRSKASSQEQRKPGMVVIPDSTTATSWKIRSFERSGSANEALL